MMTLKIGVIEDELIIARTIMNALEELEYNHCGAAINYTEALEMIANEKPDLLLIDINLSGKKDGIDIAEKVNELYQLPFIFLTSNSDVATIERAKKVKPNAYIVKPFKKEELFAAIEIAFANYTNSKQKQLNTETFANKDFLFVKDGYHFCKVIISEIIFMTTEHNYVKINMTNDRSQLVRTTMHEILQLISANFLMQIHRRYVANLNYIDKIMGDSIIIYNETIPLSKDYKAELTKKLGINP